MLVQIARAENSKILLNKTQSQTRRQHRDLILIRDSWHPPGYLSCFILLSFFFSIRKSEFTLQEFPTIFIISELANLCFDAKSEGGTDKPTNKRTNRTYYIIILDIQKAHLS